MGTVATFPPAEAHTHPFSGQSPGRPHINGASTLCPTLCQVFWGNSKIDLSFPQKTCKNKKKTYKKKKKSYNHTSKILHMCKKKAWCRLSSAVVANLSDLAGHGCPLVQCIWLQEASETEAGPGGALCTDARVSEHLPNPSPGQSETHTPPPGGLGVFGELL